MSNHVATADAAISSHSGITLTFAGPKAQAEALSFQRSFTSWLGRNPAYSTLITRRHRAEDGSDGWHCDILPGDAFARSVTITDRATGATLDLSTEPRGATIEDL